MKSYCLCLGMLLSVLCSGQTVNTFTYSVKGSDSLKLDVYMPKTITSEQKLPVIIWMHGGGFAGGSRHSKRIVELMNTATEKGYIGVSMSYRLLRKGARTGFGCQCSKQDKLYAFANAATEFLEATNFIISNSEAFQIDITKIIAGGSSAGAEAVLSAVYMKDYFIEDVSPYDHIKFAGLISFAGAMVDENYITVDNAVPTVLFHGTKDNLVPYERAAHHFCNDVDKGYLVLSGSGRVYKQLELLNQSYYLYKIEGGTHEVATTAYDELEDFFMFLNKTVINSKVIQTKRLETQH
ncbi:Carboxylesterase family protein [Formosa sp. Hel1_31_208]|uniref:alpha/beta hydrolase n=1 Tax=Formosa sp. Hel1_31_208 TaxID=1798225 RepID=UPI00087D3B80|nr:alpha/beta hydrolase [Formosa sp. Hel1_31_208]SDS23416.1 Carboxylesterase family protein [Formosa sp. Hel1_31_208]